ncbi:MAG TPA: class I SAM-dependent methyltransferase [Pyrinomonadaceae bacterium]|nr:class I SAM-dependent methyltransferase [Pyrinomonadaceae bacterium]HMP65391.1 class I SAM-dependent methyltransferase [Pyrinomonadaceae bacterium]
MVQELPERIEWAVRLLDVKPDDRIMEIGCGRGHAIGPICERLTTGHLTAIDRSPKMAEAARLAHPDHISGGKVRVVNAAIPGLGLYGGKYDKIFLFNINAFWMDPVEELREVRGLLKRDGRFYIFHQPPPGLEASEYAEAFARNLEINSLEVVKTIYAGTEAPNSVCVVSRKINRR